MHLTAGARSVKLLLELSMECESMARSEALSAADALGGPGKVIDSDPGILVIETSASPASLASRLGLCHHVSQWLGTCSPSEVQSFAASVDVPGPIRVRATKVGPAVEGVHLDQVSRSVGGVIGAGRGVDIHDPVSDVRIVFSNRAHAGRVLGSIDRTSFEKRKNRYLPFKYPASLHPKYARAMVNLTRVPVGGTVLDPFCGTGAILAEAFLVGARAIGTDLSERMASGALENLSHLGASADVRVCDVGRVAEVVGTVDGIATDPPYGRSTSTNGEKIPDLYRRAFSAFRSVVRRGSRVVMAVPDMSLLEGMDGFDLEETHGLWVHRSLTRNFCVLRRT